MKNPVVSNGVVRGDGALASLLKRLGFALLVALVLPASAVQKTVVWTLPDGWEEGVSYGTADGYLDVSGGALQRRYGLGCVGEPDLPTLTFRVAIPSGGSLVGVTAEAEWTPVKTAGRLPVPIAEPVPFGAQLVYPAPDAAAYGGTYPKSAAVAGTAGFNAGVTMVPVSVTPFKWDGASKTLGKAASMKVTVTLDVPTRLRLAAAPADASNPRSARSRAAAMTINPQDATASSGLRFTTSQTSQTPSGQIIIVSPSAFVDLWKGYAAFRKSTEAGKDFDYIVKNTAEIYADATLNTVEGDDALAIHHWLETVYDKDREQYVILGAAPKKYEYDRATMIPARYVVNQGSLDQVCDMYYGCMDRLKGGKEDPSVEVWDYDLDGTYMGHKNSGGGYSSDSNDNVDWMMEMSVTRVPLMREVAETSGNTVYRLTAAEIMDHFTNKIAFVESEARFDPPKRWRHVLGGGYLFNSYSRSSADYLVEGEREFFDGGINMFDESHASPAPDAEACPRDRNFITYSKARAARHGLINTGGLKTAEWGELYKAWGEVFDVHCHGWARGADPGTTGGALFATGLFRIYNMALPCESGMYDYCPNGSYGITNCVSMGEAPLLCFNKLGGGVVAFNNTRYGWWGGYNGMSGRMEGLINDAFYGQVGDGPMNAGEVCVYMHNNCGMYACGNRGGASNLEVVMHGDPLIRLSPQASRTWNGVGTVWTTNATDGATWTIPGKAGAQPMDYTTDLTVDATGKGATAFDIRDDLAAARFNLTGDAGQTITLAGAGTFRVTDRFVVTDADLVWNVAGGAGRNGIAFAGRCGNVTLAGNAKRYFGSAFANVNELKVTGGNVTIDTPKDATAAKNFDIWKLSFVSPSLDAEENYNVLRSRTQGLVPSDMTVAVVSNRLALQTYNIGGGTAANQSAPLFYVTNGYLKVRYNPYWGTEYFVRPTYLTDGHLVGDYDKFGLGRPDSDGYDLHVAGKSSIEGAKTILLNGELRVRLAAGAELEIANTLADGPHGKPGKLRVMGAGKVCIAAPQAFTGGIVVEEGCALELGVARAVACDIAVEQGGTLNLDEIPLDGVKSVAMADGSSLVLAGPTGEGVYQIVDSAMASLSLGATTRVYDRADLTKPLDGKLANGYFLLTANLLYWNGASGTWKNDATATANWRDASGKAAGFSDTVPVVFPSVNGEGAAAVTVEGTVKPGYVSFENADTRYAFTGAADAQIAVESLSVGNDVTFGVNLAVDHLLKVLGGRVTAADVSASLVEVAGGRFHATGGLTVPEKNVKAIKFMFAEAMNAAELPAVQELRLFRNGAFVPLPAGTRIRDIANQEIEITGCTGYAHAYKWITGSDGNETLRALVDGTTSGGNKWWASRSAAPTWFVITFPEPVDPITGYALCTADAGQKNRNPTTWSAYTSTDRETFALAGSVADFESTKSSSWLGGGNGTQAAFPLASVDGTLRVTKGGTLFADGCLAMNLEFEAGAMLAVTNRCALSNVTALATLTLPEANDAIAVDASEAAVTGTAFPILVGYHLTSVDFLKFRCASDAAVLNLRDGDLYIVTDGIVRAPYTANVQDNEIRDGKLQWSKLKWTDRNGTSFTWDDSVNYQSGGDATINVNWLQVGEATLEIDVAGALGSLSVRGPRSKDALTLVWKKAFVPRALDFSGYLGPVALDYGTDDEFALGYSDFNAGATLAIPCAGSGALTVAAGMRAVVPGWNEWAKVTGAGTIAVGTAADLLATWANANGVGGTNQVVRGKWEIANTADYPKNKEVLLTGKDALLKLGSSVDTTGYGNYTTGLTVEDGAVVQIAKRDTFNRKLTLRNGGEVRLTADATDSNRALDLFESASVFAEGAGNVFGGTAATADADTGYPTVNSGIVALRDSSGLTVTVADGATLDVYSQWGGATCTWYAWTKTGGGTMSFYRTSAQTGNMNVREGVVRLVDKGQGTTGSIVNQGEVQLVATGGWLQTVESAVSGVGDIVKLGVGASVLKGDNTYSGETVVREGTLRVGGEKALGSTSAIRLEGGVLDLGFLRFPDKTAAVTPGAKIRVELTKEEAAAQVQLVKLTEGSGDPKACFTVVVDGAELPASGYDLNVLESGAVEFRPRDFSGYEFPLETAAADARDWTAFSWYDQQGSAFKSNWCDYVSIGAVVKVGAGEAAAMTLDEEDVNLSQLTVRNAGSLAVSNGTKRLTASAIDVTGDGETRLDFDLGAATLLADGKVTLTQPGTGAMKILAGAEVTLVDAAERGTVSLSEGAVLRYAGTAEKATLPWMTTDNRTGGAIAYAMPVALASGEAVFGGEGESPAATYGDFVFEDGFAMSVARLVTGNGAGSVQRFRQTGGELAVTDEPLLVGKGGAVGWTTAGGVLKAAGLVDGGVAGSSFALAGGTLELGTDGIAMSANADLTFAGGMVRNVGNATISAANGVFVTGDTCFEAAAGTTLTVASSVSGPGTVWCGGEGTVLFLGDCKNASLAGRFTIRLQKYQEDNGDTSSYLFDMPAGADDPVVTILGTDGQPATGGGGVRSNDGLKYHWRPTGKYVQPITATLTGGTVALGTVSWYDATGTKASFSHLRGDIELQLNVSANTTINNADDRRFAKMRINGPGKLTINNDDWMYQLFGCKLVFEEADVRTDVDVSGQGLRIEKLTGLAAGKTLVLTRADQLGSFGDGPFYGTLNCRNFEPPWMSVFGDASRWLGTLKLASSGKTLAGEDRFWDEYGNRNSKLELSGYYTGYLKPGGSTSMDLKLNGYLRFQDGYSVDGGYTFAGPLTGSGALYAEKSPSGRSVLDVIQFTGDASGFSGEVEVSGGHCIAFGEQADDDSGFNKIVIKKDVVIASNKKWSAEGGIDVKAGGRLTVMPRAGGDLATSSEVTVLADGTLDLFVTGSPKEIPVTEGKLSVFGALCVNGIEVTDYEIDGGTVWIGGKDPEPEPGEEEVVIRDAKWGNVGTAEEGGVATDYNRGNYTCAWTVDFGATDNICMTDIGTNGTVKITTIRIAARDSNDINHPGALTITQGDKSVTSSKCEFKTGALSVYRPNGTVIQTYPANVFTFASDVTFSTAEPLTLRFDTATTGVGVIKPANSKLVNGGWTPIVEVTGDYTYRVKKSVDADKLAVKLLMTRDNAMRVAYEFYKADALVSSWTNADEVTLSNEGSYAVAGAAQNVWWGNGNHNIGTGVVAKNFDTGWKGWPVFNSNICNGGSKDGKFWYFDIPFALTNGAFAAGRFLPKTFITNNTGRFDDGGQPAGDAKRVKTTVTLMTADKAATVATGVSVSEVLTSQTVNTQSGEFACEFANRSNYVLRVRVELDSGACSGAFAGIQGIEFRPQASGFARTIAAGTAEADFATEGWSPEPAVADYAAGVDWIVTNKAASATLTFRSDVSLGNFKVAGEAGTALKLKAADGVSVSVGSYDLAANAGELAVGPWFGTALDVSGAKVSGTSAATLCFDLGAGNALAVSGTTAAGDRMYGLAVTSGTLSFATTTGGATPFRSRVVTARGADAAIRLGAVDATGYNAGAAKIVLADGGRLLVGVRDTLISPIELRGGKVVLQKGCANGYRALDLFGNNSWNVTADSALEAADDATADDRKVLLRNGDWNVTVGAAARLEVGAAIVGKETLDASGTPGKFVKKGAGELVLTAASTYSSGTAVEEGVVTVTSDAALGTGGVTLSSAGTINVRSDVVTNAYALCKGKITLADDATIANVTVNGEAPEGVWKFNDATNGILQVIAEKDYPDGEDTSPLARMVIDNAVENGLVNASGKVLAAASDVAAAVKAASAGTSTPEQRRITNSMMLGSEELVGDDVALATDIAMNADGTVTVTVSGENCTLREGPVVLGYLVLWSADSLTGAWTPTAVTEVTAENAATVTPPESALPSRFFRSSFEWKRPQGL